MIPNKCASTSSKTIQPIKENIIIECEEKIITYQAYEVGLHSTKEVLRNHLCAKLKEISPGTDALPVSILLVHRYPSADIFNFLQDPALLITKVQTLGSETSVPSDEAVTQNLVKDEVATENPNIRKGQKLKVQTEVQDDGEAIPNKQQMEPVSQEKLQIGEDLFPKVAEFETELCAQITGMLLEMDKDSLKKLLLDDEELETAVSKAKTRYLVKHHPGVLPGKEDMGEEIYEAVHNMFPKYASKITGMILELDYTTLQQLLDNPSMLEERARIAYGTVSKCSS